MNEKRITGSWWVAILAFVAGMAVHAAASGPRPESSTLLAATPESALSAPVSGGGGGYGIADADRDTCSVQLN
jgi:hypothetical protein